MNDLSWLIYLAGVCESIATVLTIIAILSAFSVVGFSALYFISYGDHGGPFEVAKISAIRFGIVFAVTSLVASAIPGKQTVYAIAASEMGEKALNTPTAGKALKALDSWLDKQIIKNDKDREDEEE